MNQAIIVTKKLAAIALASMLLSSCGVTQTVTDGTVAVTKAIFYKQVKMLHLDIRAREGANNNAQGHALATVVRIYQLKARQAFDSTDYPSLFTADGEAIAADLLAEKDITVRPGEAVTVDMPMEKTAQYVAVAAMFLSPDLQKNTWRVVLERNELDPDNARRLELNQQTLSLLPVKHQ